MQLTFKFNVDDVVQVQVKTISIVGVIKMVAFDRGGKLYFVSTGKDSNWWYEDQLEIKE